MGPNDKTETNGQIGASKRKETEDTAQKKRRKKQEEERTKTPEQKQRDRELSYLMLEETERRGKDQHKRNADNEVPWADGVMGRKENNNHTKYGLSSGGYKKFPWG